MSSIVLDQIDAEIATLTRLVPVPTGELGYGRDLSCVTDISETLEEVDPDSTQGLGEALLRRMTTSRGSLPDDPDYGIDVPSWCNRAVPENEILALEGEIKAELKKDDRVSEVIPVVTWTPNRKRLDVNVRVVPEIPGLEPFSLTMAVEDGSVLLAEVNG